MFRPSAACGVCKLIVAGDTKLEKRINNSRQYSPVGESILEIHRDYADKIKLPKSLYRHAKNHQGPNVKALEKRIVARKTKDALEEIQVAESRRQLGIYKEQGRTRAELIDHALKMLEEGGIKMTGSNLVSLLAQEQKAEENAKDRGLEMMKMFNYFASGAGGAGNVGPQADFEGDIID